MFGVTGTGGGEESERGIELRMNDQRQDNRRKIDDEVEAHP